MRPPRPRRRRKPDGVLVCAGLVLFLLKTKDTVTMPVGLQCPPPGVFLECPCYNFDDGVYIECIRVSGTAVKSVLERIMQHARTGDAAIQSLSIIDLERKTEELNLNMFPEDALIRHLRVSHSSIRDITEDAFRGINRTIQSFGLMNSKLTSVPQKGLRWLGTLSFLDLEGNMIGDLPNFSFSGISLLKLSMKNNQIGRVAEFAFSGLEESLAELNLSENRIRIFPMTALRRLENLDTLTISTNLISSLPEDGYSLLERLRILDLSSNRFIDVPVNCFRCCKALKSLSLYHNSIGNVDKDGFISLVNLESIDLSHNRIESLHTLTFRANEKLKSIDLSHNHIHSIRGIFGNLPLLKELYLAENNILELPPYVFYGSRDLSIVCLQHNAIKDLDSKSLAGLEHLAELHLTGNYIEKIPKNFLDPCLNLSILALDKNSIQELEVGTFAKSKVLREIRLQDNQITEVKRGVFAPLPSLLELHLQNNAITDMETGALKELHNLQHINLQDNLLAVLGDIFLVSNNSKSSKTANSLVSIQLENNGIGVMHNDTLKGQAGIKVMWLGHNKLTRLQAPLFKDLKLVERLYLTNNTINRIDDSAFQTMQTLNFLDLSVNKLTHITVKTFSTLHDLEELYLSENNLRRLDPYALTALKRLRVLDLSDNQLTALHDKMFQEGLPIRSLYLKNCSISIIERGTFRGLNNLYELNLEKNRLTASILDRLDIPGLRILRISHNNFSLISSESLDGLPSLQVLSMEFSHIRTLPMDVFSRKKYLEKIFLSGNLLTTLPATLFFDLESLKEIKLDSNQFQDIPYEVFINTSSVETLSLAFNSILHVDMSRLHGLTNLRELDLRHNRIMTLSGFASIKLAKIRSVDLSYNHLAALPPDFFIYSTLLKKVELSGNKLRQIPTAALSTQNLPNLNELNITANPLVRVYEIFSNAKHPSLQEIHVTHTNLTIITSQDFQAFPELLHLFMSSNSIFRISPGAFRHLSKLITLDLGSNEVEFLPQERLTGLKQLKLLNLTHNRLKELEDFTADLKALEMLDLSFNQINRIGSKTFEHLGNLVELNLFGNWISSIATDGFTALKQLHTLDIRQNYLERFPLHAIKPLEAHLRKLHAEGNPLTCDCQSQDIWEWLRNHRKLLGSPRKRKLNFGLPSPDTEEVGLLRCESPSEVHGMVFIDLAPITFCPDPLVTYMEVEDVQTYSVLISWQGNKRVGLSGYRIAYHTLNNPEEILSKMAEPTDRNFTLENLIPNTRYKICVIGQGEWSDSEPVETNELLPSPEELQQQQQDKNLQPQEVQLQQQEEQLQTTETTAVDTPKSLLTPNAATSRCIEILTLEMPDAIASSDGSTKKLNDTADAVEESVLTRRLGLIIGFCLGSVVFLLLVSILGYLKVRKSRDTTEREQQAVPPETASFRHYSIQGGETCPAAAAKQLQNADVIEVEEPEEAGTSAQPSQPLRHNASFITTANYPRSNA